MEQSEIENVKHAEIIPGPKRQAPPLLSSKRLFLLSTFSSSSYPLQAL